MKKLLIITTLFFVAIMYVFAQTKKPLKPQQPKVPASNPAASAARGKIVYTTTCLSCHQADGGGVPHLNPPLYESTNVVGDKKKIIAIVLNGMTDRIPIDGEYYSNNMASHKNLTDVQIADVLTFVRSSWGNKASAVTPEEVKAVRSPKKK